MPRHCLTTTETTTTTTTTTTTMACTVSAMAGVLARSARAPVHAKNAKATPMCARSRRVAAAKRMTSATRAAATDAETYEYQAEVR